MPISLENHKHNKAPYKTKMLGETRLRCASHFKLKIPENRRSHSFAKLSLHKPKKYQDLN